MTNQINKSRVAVVRGEKSFSFISHLILIFLSIITICPFLLIIIASVTDENTLLSTGYSFFPNVLSLNAYEYLWGQAKSIFNAYKISFLVTIIGTAGSILITTMIAYPISRKDFKYRNIFSFFVFFTMLFNGGVVPAYIMWSRFFHLQNTIWALILPNYFATAFNVLLMKNYYANNIPGEMIEAAQIDGASEYTIFRKIMLPLSIPSIATIGIFTALIYWNDWTNSLYFIREAKLYSIQYYLIALMQNIKMLASGNTSITSGALSAQMPTVSIRMALAVIGTLPIMIAFPFFQKFFVKGVVVGAVKG